MSIRKIQINNFRSIKKLDVSITSKNKVLCFVGENGSSKTALMTTITEAIASHTKLEFPNYSIRSGKRLRLLSASEIMEGEKFYSIEIDYEKLKGAEHTFKKIVATNKTIDPSVYSDVIQGITLQNDSSKEISTLTKADAHDDFLFDSVFLFRPGERYEKDGMLIEKDGDWEGELSVARHIDLSMPYPYIVAHSGNDTQTTILDLFFDSQVGYEDARFGFSNILTILNKVTGKNFGRFQIAKSPYRQVFSSTLGELSSFSQGELDLLVTISTIVKQQSFFFDRYSDIERENLSINNLFHIPGIILIDEVDLHLHPKAQENYLKILTDIFPNIQFIVTTHSPFVIRGLPENSIVVQLPSGRKFENNFSAMNIDSITNIIFGHDGGFSEDTRSLLDKFKLHLVEEVPNRDELQRIYQQLSSSHSAKEELDLYLATFAKEELINIVRGV
ncbi:ATP-binding involved in virulence-like protein [Photobacterium leiognathi lrivu.4.1]|uniref:ATP-binding involved in virulence-like protein n=1 Tax=Photobacterium leiognathi lrivu.4.1 TaxID=1248232 RepID=V5H302_PHOLE|nr:AAA family ATPase [Photobacterium leiognathi]GAD31457.1 ATP-binding involved in virulence-like protein [Photobacterium leiognathi lrivu.4.1]